MLEGGLNSCMFYFIVHDQISLCFLQSLLQLQEEYPSLDMSEKWTDMHDKVICTLSLCLIYSGCNKSCVQVVDRWLDNARERRALSLLSRTWREPRGRMSIGDRRLRESEGARESRVRVEMKMRNGREEEAVVIETETGRQMDEDWIRTRGMGSQRVYFDRQRWRAGSGQVQHWLKQARHARSVI